LLARGPTRSRRPIRRLPSRSHCRPEADFLAVHDPWNRALIAHRKGTINVQGNSQRLFIGSLIAFAAGSIVAVLAIGIAVANDVFVMDGNDIAAVQGGALAWSLIGVAVVGFLAAAGGVVVGFVAWIGAVLNTWQLESKAWFIGLLLLGIFNFGFIAMIAYVIAGPDDKAAAAARVAPAPAAA
jgi:hypothetical protein